MDLEDILEAVGKIFAAIGIALLAVLAVVLLAYCFFGWLLAVAAFVQGKVALGFILLIVWMVVSGARLSW